RGFPMDPKDRAARRDRLRARAVTTTVVATVVAAPVLALWAAYRGSPAGESHEGPSVTAREESGPDTLGGGDAGGYENAGNAGTRPGPRIGKDGKADVSVEVVGVAGGGRTKAGAGHLAVTAANDGDTTLITLKATGDAPTRWSVATTTGWLYFSRSSGTLRPGESFTVKVYVDHLREPAGHWSARVAVAPAGAVVSIDGYGTAPPVKRGPTPPARPTPTPTGSASAEPTSSPSEPTSTPTPTESDTPSPTGSASPTESESAGASAGP
ncbi:hypothetical protein AB0D38_26395, partial [Streptomyces sp. NPDC048279]|uniref:BACON domain-containing protein n=1 Tax=Streptomyces sp. NPDC048279 TaxID=3154714 RepID=UPI00343725B6